MSYTGINLENVKTNNRSAILKLLNDQGAMSRKDIASALGLTPATVTIICSDLLAANALTVLGEVQENKRAGRRKVLLGLNYDRFRVISISIESSETCVTLTNLHGENGICRRIPTDSTVPPHAFLEQVARETMSLVNESGIPVDSILGAGVTVPGIVHDDGVSSYAYRIWNEPVHIRDILREHLPFRILVENNVRAFAEAELIFGSGKDRENLLFVKWGPGVGSAIVIHKRIYDSNRSKNAEIGHIVLAQQGRRCRCGRIGCLETFVGTHAMCEQLRNRCTPETMPQLYDFVKGDLTEVTAHNFISFLSLEDPAMWEIIDRNVALLARSVSNIITMLAPDNVIVYGKLFDQPALMDRFLATCQSIDATYGPDYITRSSLRDKIDFIGPLAVVVNRRFLNLNEDKAAT